METQVSTSETPPGQQLSDQDVQLINRLFRELTAIFPGWRHAFKNAEQIAEAKRQWTKGFIENKITDWDLIDCGLSIARRSKSDFLPSVGKFVGWCREGHLEKGGIPWVDDAYKEATTWIGRANQHEWSHPVVYHAAVETGRQELLSKSERDMFPKFKYCYDRAIDLFLANGTLYEPPKVITQQKGDDMTLEERKAALQKLREETGL